VTLSLIAAAGFNSGFSDLSGKVKAQIQLYEVVAIDRAQRSAGGLLCSTKLSSDTDVVSRLWLLHRPVRRTQTSSGAVRSCRRLKWSKSFTWDVSGDDQARVRSCPP